MGDLTEIDRRLSVIQQLLDGAERELCWDEFLAPATAEDLREKRATWTREQGRLRDQKMAIEGALAP